MEFVNEKIVFLTTGANNTAPTDFEVDVILTTAVLSAVLSIATCVANGALLFIIYKDPFKRFRKPTTVFIVSLSLSDFMSGGVAELFYAIRMFLRADMEMPRYEALYMTQKGVTHFIVNVSVLIVTAMSMDRLLSIYKPFRYKVLVTSYRVLVCNIVIWIYCISFTMTGLVIPPHDFFQIDLHLHTTLPVIIMVTCYIGIYALIRKNQRNRLNMVAPVSNGAVSQRSLLVQKRVSVAILIVIVLIFVGLMPYFVVINVGIACEECTREKWFVFFNYFSPTFLFFNSALNPWLYAWRLMDYRQAFCSLFSISTPVVDISTASGVHQRNSNNRGASTAFSLR